MTSPPDYVANVSESSLVGSEILLPGEVASILRCSDQTVYNLFAAGKLTGFRLGRSIRLFKTSVYKLASEPSKASGVPAKARKRAKTTRKSPRPRIGVPTLNLTL